MKKLPLLSSKQIIRTLERAGFKPARKPSGSHLSMVKQGKDHKIVAVVVLGKKEVPRGTLKNIIKLAELNVDEFMSFLKK